MPKKEGRIIQHTVDHPSQQAGGFGRRLRAKIEVCEFKNMVTIQFSDRPPGVMLKDGGPFKHVLSEKSDTAAFAQMLRDAADSIDEFSTAAGLD